MMNYQSLKYLILKTAVVQSQFVGITRLELVLYSTLTKCLPSDSHTYSTTKLE